MADMAHWPFFRMQLDMLEMVLAKADPDLAQYYARRLTTAAQQKSVARLGERADVLAAALLKLHGETSCCRTTRRCAHRCRCATRISIRCTCCRRNCSRDIATRPTTRPRAR